MGRFPQFYYLLQKMRECAKDPEVMDRFERLNASKEVVPEASKKLKMNDYVGKFVSLKRDLTTNGGEQFKIGDVFEVYGHWRGCLHLVFKPINGGMSRREIRKVHHSYVVVLDG